MKRFVGKSSLVISFSKKQLVDSNHRLFSSTLFLEKKSSIESLLSSIEKTSGIKKNKPIGKPSSTANIFKPNRKKTEENKNKKKGSNSSTSEKSIKSSQASKSATPETNANNNITEEEDVVAIVQKLRKEMKESQLKLAIEQKKGETQKKKDDSSFKIVKKPKRDQTNTNSMPIAEYTSTKLQDKKFATMLQNKVNTEDDISKIVEWGIKHDVRYNLENILLPNMDTTPEEIEEKKKKKAELRKVYEDYVKSVPEEEEEKRGQEEISFKQYVNSLDEEEEEIAPKKQLPKQLPKNIEVVESDKLSSKPHKKTDLQKLSQKLSTLNKKPSSFEELAHKEIMDSKEKLEEVEKESNPTLSTTVLQLNDEQYNNAMTNPTEFNKQWELKGYSPVIQNNHGRKILILYPIGTNTKKFVERAKRSTNNNIDKPIVTGSKGRIPLRDLLVDESTKDEVDLESSNFDERDLEKKLIDAKNYFLEYGYDISDLNTILKEDEKIKKKEKKEPQPLKSSFKTYNYDKLQTELENEDNEAPTSNLLDEYLGDDDPNQVFQSLEEKNLLLSEYETKSEYAMFSEDIHPYLKKSPKENEDKLRREIANMSIGSISLPPELVDGVSEIVSEYPKNLIQRTAQILSAAFRLRTNGLEKNPKVFSRSEEEKRLNKDESPEDELFREQLEVLKHLRSYKETSKKKKRPIDIEKMKKDSEEDFNRTYNPQIIYKELESAAYIAHRLPAIYGTSYRVFSEAVMRMPDFEPKTMLDFGTGPGTTIWAAHEAFGGTVREVMAVEPSTAMMDVASRLFEYMNNRPHITWRRFLNEHSSKQYDLVVASFVMNELSNSQERERIVKALWKVTSGVLIIIEPGTPVGFDFIREARSTVLSQKYGNIDDKPTILAPCPHDSVCPMAGTPKWCHFAQRVEREEFQKLTKQAKKQYENENYSFIAFKRHGLNGFKYGEQVEKEEEEEMRKKQLQEQLPDSVVEKEIAIRKELRGYAREFSHQSFRWPRITDTPLKRGGHVITSMCLPEATLSKVIISKADGKQGYKYLRKTLKGDLYPYPLTQKNLKASTEMEKYFKDLE